MKTQSLCLSKKPESMLPRVPQPMSPIWMRSFAPSTERETTAAPVAVNAEVRKNLRLFSIEHSFCQLLQVKRIKRISSGDQNVLVSVKHIRFRSVRHLAQTCVPQNLSVSRVICDQVAGGVSGEQQFAGGRLNAIFTPQA